MSDIYLAVSETPTVVTLTSAVINSAVASSVTVMNTVTVALDANSLSALENVTVTVGAAITGTVTVSNFPATQAVSLASVPTHAISGTVTASISGAVFSNESGEGAIPNEAVAIGWVEETGAGANFNFASKNNPLPISGTVTIGSALPAGTNRIGVVTIGAGTVTIGAGTAQIGSVTVSGTVTASVTSSSLLFSGLLNEANTLGSVSRAVAIGFNEDQTSGEFRIPNTDGSSPFPVCIVLNDGAGYANGVGNGINSDKLPISGTVTANSSNGSLTTRFGSVVTANTAFATSAVTNANRKYLLIQNVTTASNVITVGIGFTPTTTQGIQLSSGAGLTFEGSYIPTGAVNLLSSVTASCFTILEA